MSNSSAVSNFTKFKILLWKNYKLQVARKGDFIFISLSLILIFGLLIYGRYKIRVLRNENKTYKPDSIDSFPESLTGISGLKKTVLYSPESDTYEEIVSAAAKKLSISHEGFKDESEVVAKLIKNNYFAGIKFTTDNINSNPNKFAFELRFPAKIRSDALGVFNWNTNKLSPNYKKIMYSEEGFVQLQNALVMSYLEKLGNTPNLPNIKVNRLPSAAMTNDKLNEIIAFVPHIFTFNYFTLIIMVVRQVAQERETQIKEIMIIIGLQNILHWCAWFVKSFIMFGLLSFIIVILLKVPFVANGAVFPESNSFALLIVLCAYSVAVIMFCFLNAVLFKKSGYAVALAVFILLFSNFIKFLAKSFISGILLCLIPHIAFIYAMEYSIKMEHHVQGLQLKHFFRMRGENDSVGPFICLIMFAVDTILYFLLCLYMEQINTGEYGIAKKWYFPLQKDFWQRNKNDSDRGKGGGNRDEGVVVENLSKKFGDRVVVNNISFAMHPNRITVLLGRNGAGKSTTILMLTGLLKPTSGTAYINGYDIRKELQNARQSIGLCPQQNALFDNLSVRDHIIFFSRAKGLHKKAAIEEQIDRFTEITDLSAKKSTFAKNLSGGMKRKLCLCCSLCGNSKVVLCDEPSSGVDPASRRRLWSLLQSEKHTKAILLTTHFMDEAEALADHIVVLREGEVMFGGSIADMRNRFGMGYCLVCDMQEDCSIEEVTSFLQRHMRDITLESQRGTTLTYRLPPGDMKTYVHLFRDLENNLHNLRLASFGVNISTVDEVFTHLAAGNEENTSEDEDIQNYDLFSNRLMIRHSGSRYCQRIKGLFLKLFLLLKRNLILWLALIIVPDLILWLIYFLTNESNLTDLPALSMDITKYDKGEAMLELSKSATTNKKIADAYEAYATSFGAAYTLKSTNGEPLQDFLIATMKKHPDVNVTENLLIGATIGAAELTAWHNDLYSHAMPLSLNFLHNAIARVYVDSNAKISVTNYPMPFKQEDLDATNIHLAQNLGFLLSILTAIFICYPVKDRASALKLQQYLAGVNFFQYWITIYLVDFIILMLTCLGMLLVCVCLSDDGLFPQLLIICTLFSLVVLLWMYIFSFFFQAAGIAFYIAVFLNMATNIMGSLFLKSFHWEEKYTVVNCLRLLPCVNLEMSLSNVYMNKGLRDICHSLEEKYNKDSCFFDTKCCSIPDSYSSTRYGMGTEIIYYIMSWILYVIILILFESQIGMFLSSLCSKCNCFGENSILNRKPKKRKKGQKKRSKAGGQREEEDENEIIDDDVAMEEEHIQMMTKADAREMPLIVDRIGKYYGQFYAVRRVSFCVEEEECFGLLGINGAGKTTTFKMLTANTWINKGNAYIYGHGLKSYLKRPNPKIGYCTQNDTIYPNLTGREHLRIFIRLNGVHTRHIASLSYVLSSRMDFTKHMDKQTKNLSGGNQRKLCTAIALLGNPQLIFLDEPSSGMDPVTRRQLWKLITQLRESCKPIVLTTHSMEECEALCTRLGIMVAGRLRCLGSIQHLKSKFSKGYVLKITVLKSGNRPEHSSSSKTSTSVSTTSATNSTSLSSLDYSTSSDNNLSAEEKAKIYKDNIKYFIESKLPAAELTEEHDHSLIYHVPKRVIKYSDMFALMEKHRKHLRIDDYTISQTTLDDIFIGFSAEAEKAKAN